jgi:hypothetical protein
MAANARREMLPFPIDLVTQEMRTKMFHVIAMPSALHLGVNEFALAASVHRIVLTDATAEFCVTVVDKAGTKSFRVKAKVFSSLFAA